MAKRQTQIPGTERPAVPELDSLCEPYAAALYERMELQRSEKDLKKQILERMKQLKRSSYTFFDDEDNEYEFEIESTKKLKVRRKRPDSGGGEASDGDEE